MTIRSDRWGGPVLAAALTFAGGCANSPTGPAAAKWVIDAAPFPSLMQVADRIKLDAVVIDSLGLLHANVAASTFEVSDSKILQLRGDTLLAVSIGRAELIISGSWQGRTLTARRPVVVAVRPGGSASASEASRHDVSNGLNGAKSHAVGSELAYALH